MEKYLRINKEELILINSQYNTIQEGDIKISEEVFEYYLTLFDKVYNKKTIIEKEINTKEELNKYLKDEEKTEIVIEDFSISNDDLLNQIAELRLELRSKILKLEKSGGN